MSYASLALCALESNIILRLILWLLTMNPQAHRNFQLDCTLIGLCKKWRGATHAAVHHQGCWNDFLVVISSSCLPAATGVRLSTFSVWGADLAPAGPEASVAVCGSEPLPLPSPEKVWSSLGFVPENFKVPEHIPTTGCDTQDGGLIEPFTVSQLAGCVLPPHCLLQMEGRIIQDIE